MHSLAINTFGDPGFETIQGAEEPAIEHLTHIHDNNFAPKQPRSVGASALSVRANANGGTEIATLRHSGALKLIFPTTHRPDVEAVSINTGGGIAGGDQFRAQATVGTGATLTITTQAAERAYRAQTGETGRLITDLKVEDGALLQWLPQELILFDGAALHRRLDITLAATSRLLMVEPVVFGRAAMGEQLTALHFEDRIKITRDGLPVYIDGMQLHGNVARHLASPAIAGGAGAMVSLVMIAPDAARHLEHLRTLLPPTGGASMVAPDILTLRLVAPDSLEMRRTLVPILDLLTGNRLPLAWRL